MTVEEFEKRLPDGIPCTGMTLDGGHVTAAFGGETEKYRGYILWNEQGKAYVRLQQEDDARILPFRLQADAVVFCGVLYMRYSGFDLKEI